MSGPGGAGAADPQEAARLGADAAALGVPLDAAQVRRLLRLLDELAQWNRAYNLTTIVEREAMIRAHLLDSLSALPYLAGTRIADVGTGAGFPGLPLAIAAPQWQFTLIDSVAKKIRFVSHAVRTLGVANVEPVHARVETLVPKAPFDTVITRAYAALPQLLRSVQGLCGAATRVVALKGRHPQAELAQLPAGWRLEQALAIEVPGLGAERTILTFVQSGRGSG